MITKFTNPMRIIHRKAFPSTCIRNIFLFFYDANKIDTWSFPFSVFFQSSDDSVSQFQPEILLTLISGNINLAITNCYENFI